MELEGAYLLHDNITEEDMIVFDRVMNKLLGVFYEPVLAATQIVNGANYCFICKTIDVARDAPEGISKVIIYKPFNGDPVISSIEEIL